MHLAMLGINLWLVCQSGFFKFNRYLYSLPLRSLVRMTKPSSAANLAKWMCQRLTQGGKHSMLSRSSSRDGSSKMFSLWEKGVSRPIIFVILLWISHQKSSCQSGRVPPGADGWRCHSGESSEASGMGRSSLLPTYLPQNPSKCQMALNANEQT